MDHPVTITLTITMREMDGTPEQSAEIADELLGLALSDQFHPDDFTVNKVEV